MLAMVLPVACEDGRDDAAQDGPSDAATSVAPEPARHATIESCEGLETEILNAPPTRDGLARVHGAPDSTFAWTEPNRHVEGATDSLFTAYYPGLIANFRTPTGGSDLIVDATITSNRFISDPGLGIGMDEAEIIHRLGEPTDRERGSIVYNCGMGADQPVTFELYDGAVNAISISYYVD